jgi:uncharacterized membrane protein
VVGAAVAAYLSYVGLFDARIACPTGGCETVQSSRYAEVGGMPIAVAGLGAWLAVLAATLARGVAAVAAAALVAVAGALVSAYLLYVQAFVLEAFCIWCVVSDVLMLTVAALATVRLLRSAG